MYIDHCYTTDRFKISTYFEHHWPTDIIIHKEIGPARIIYTENGDILKLIWAINHTQHRNNKVSGLEYMAGNIALKQFCINGLYHNMEVPAHIKYTKKGKIIEKHWYLDGKFIAASYKKFITYIKKNKPLVYAKYIKQKAINIFD